MKKHLSLSLIVSIFINLILFAIKLYIGIRTNSLCIYTDAMNNLFDVLASAVGFIGVLFIFKKATAKHPFGFGRLEYLTGFIMAILMFFAGLSFAYSGLERFFAPTPVWYLKKYAVIIFATSIVKLLMGIFFGIKHKKEPSPILNTLKLDSLLDFAITLTTLVSFTLSNYIGFTLDSILALIISLIICYEGIKLIFSSASQLLGHSNDELKSEIAKILDEISSDIVINEIIIHSYGRNKTYVDLFLQADENKSILKKEIKNRLKEINITSVVEWEDLL